MRKKIKSKVKLERTVGFTTIVLTSILMLSFLFPTNTNNTNAVTADSSNPITDSAKLKAETYVYSTLAVSLSESVNLDVVPKAGGSFTTGGANLTVTTNNTTGYQVYLQTGDNTSTLRPANGMIDAEIKPVVGEMNESNFHQNLDTWGYAIGQAEASLNSMNYKALPSASSPAVITTDQLAAKDSYTLGFATAVSPNLPAGKYYNSVLVSVVANPIAVHTLSGITYMQEMSPYVCDYSDEHETKQLIDTRDGKSYWVAKLKDGNCWMTQNLALDLSTDKALTPEDSDVSANWVPSSSTEREIPEKDTDSNADNTRSWNLGEVVLINPSVTEGCDNINTGEKITACKWYKSIDDMTAGYEATLISTVSPDESSYDAHYLIGNYYQFNAVAAGTGENLTSPNSSNQVASDLKDAPSSICPRGWRMPTSGRYTDGTISYPYGRDDSFVNLMAAYGYPAGEEGKDWNYNSGFPFIGFLTADGSRLDYLPISFVRSGSVSLSSGWVDGLGNFAWYRSGTASTPDFAFSMAFGINVNDGFMPSYREKRTNGFSVRCVAR